MHPSDYRQHRCAASRCREPLVEGATGDRQPVVWGAQKYHRVCARRKARFLERLRREREEETDCA